jgi:hypothetical protein
MIPYEFSVVAAPSGGMHRMVGAWLPAGLGLADIPVPSRHGSQPGCAHHIGKRGGRSVRRPGLAPRQLLVAADSPTAYQASTKRAACRPSEAATRAGPRARGSVQHTAVRGRRRDLPPGTTSQRHAQPPPSGAQSGSSGRRIRSCETWTSSPRHKAFAQRCPIRR